MFKYSKVINKIIVGLQYSFKTSCFYEIAGKGACLSDMQIITWHLLTVNRLKRRYPSHVQF